MKGGKYKPYRETLLNAHRLLSEIPETEWIKGMYSNCADKCCAIGHYQRLTSKNPSDYSLPNCWDVVDDNDNDNIRRASRWAIGKLYGEFGDIAGINNYENDYTRNPINGFDDVNTKSNVMAFLTECKEKIEANEL